MKAGWKTRMDERRYFEAKIAARQPKPKAKRAKPTKTEAALDGILECLYETHSAQVFYGRRIANEIKSQNENKSIPTAIGGLGVELKATLGGIAQNLIAIYAAMPPEQRDKDIRIMRDALVAMSNGAPNHRG